MSYHVWLIDYFGELKHLIFYKNEYRNFMEMIVDKLGEDIGYCKGRAWCGTCHVELINGVIEANIDDDEKDTLNKLSNNKKASRLACQLMADEQLNGLTFRLLSEDYYE
ncbi:MAG: 2Fe-2S iron-sulfur cluster-binding protein [Vicingaceae bacterium]